MERRLVRIGIDVGGTHTKAVAIDNSTQEIIGKSSVMTTHHSENGVADGVAACFVKCIQENNIDPKDVVFIAHSTTQATNALLEGDVVKVGIVGMSKGGLEKLMAKGQMRIGDIPLGTGRSIHTCYAYEKTPVDAGQIGNAVDQLMADGAEVIVATKAFGVDNNEEEELVQTAAAQRGLSCTKASDITKLYGLKVRTQTAAINASILPKMINTAQRTESSVRKTGVQVPLMMMRGDGGVMDIGEMKKRPVLTMLSGPAASVMGALVYLRASNGVYFEVGGTSTNIGVIKDGRPTVNYAVVGDHRTYISSLDVRVLGVAGGSMPRVSKSGVVDVGPRSAHIANLPYAAFTPAAEIVNPKLVLYSPLEGDPEDYACIEVEGGKRIALTNTCAANILGFADDTTYAHGDVDACRKAFQPLADYMGKTVEQVAEDILAKASDKIVDVIEELAHQYRLELDQSVLVGCGGGAASLLPYTAKRMSMRYKIPENAEVISSIGVALAMVRDVVERTIPEPSKEDIASIKREAMDKAIESGASPDSIEVHIEIDSQAHRLTAIATGSTEVQAADLMKRCDENEAREIAAESLGVAPDQVETLCSNNSTFVFQYVKGHNHMIRVVDKKGFIRIQRRDGGAKATTVAEVKDVLTDFWDRYCFYQNDTKLQPDLFVAKGAKLIDMSGVLELQQAFNILDTEIADAEETEQVLVIAAKNMI